MTGSKRTVNLQQMPEEVTESVQTVILQSLERKCAETERPRFVLDCSLVRNMDTNTIQLLLSCLEEVMKCNGDVRLAALRPEAEDTLRRSGVSRLFEMYATVEAAVQSFQKRAASMAPLDFEVEVLDLNSGLAA
ncbi:MAG TPA: STAS domain-containing protein [Acidobacteriaceae bacterium]